MTRHPNAVSWPRVLPLLLVLAGFGTPAAAQREDTIRQRFRLPLAPTAEVPARGALAAPGISIGTPTAFGAGFGDAFVGAGVQSRTRLLDRMDGGVFAGFGLGDPRELVGLEVVATSFGTLNSCCRGGISAKLHRLLPASSAIALGVENGVLWRLGYDGPATDAGTSVYGVVSKVFAVRQRTTSPFSTLTLSLGAGTGRFRSEGDLLADRERFSPFGSASLRIVEPLSLLGEWTGQELAVGASILPLRDRPLVITPAVTDLRTLPRFVLGVGYGFDYTRLF